MGNILTKVVLTAKEELDKAINKLSSIADDNKKLIEENKVAKQVDLDKLSSQMDDKANESEVVKKGQVDLDEMTERTLEAIQGGAGTSFNLLSIPRDGSVTPEKTDFVKYGGVNILDSTKGVQGTVYKRNWETSTIAPNDMGNSFTFPSVKLKANKTYFISNIRVSLSFIIIGTYDDKTHVYSGEWQTVQSFLGITEDFIECEITPTKDCYLLISATTLNDLASIDTSYVYQGDSRPTEYPKYNEYNNIKISKLDLTENLKRDNVIIVSKDGLNGACKTIQQAVNTANNGDTIIVYPGVYHEYVICIDKEINIVGINKSNCILQYDSNSYSYHPLSIACGSLSNMTVHAIKKEGDEANGTTPYAVHIDFDYQKDKSLYIENVDMIGDWQAGCGIGLKGGFNLKFKNCEFISNADTVNGALFFHDNNITGYNGISNITFDNCRIKSKGTIAIMPKSFGNVENITNMSFYNTIVYSEVSGKTNACVGVGRPVQGDGWRQYNNFFLSDDSFGNNIALFNA